MILQQVLRSHLHRITDTAGEPEFTKLAGDGSNRSFYRVSGPRGSLIGVLPEGQNEIHLKESKSYYYIGKHLESRGVPVPTILAYDPKTGAILMEDLGDIHLERVVKAPTGTVNIRNTYSEILTLLIHMQFEGVKGFDVAYCFDTSEYNRKIMLERESAYFVESFLQGYLGLDVPWEELEQEFGRLADLASEEKPSFLLHRDFQSRNIIISNGCPRVIDFQGARLGPLGYDLASLLFDPYVDLPEALKQELFEEYMNTLTKHHTIRHAFQTNFWYLALQRALQVLGAFGFLTKVKQKPFFEAYIPVALKNLKGILEREAFLPFKRLRGIVNGI